MTNRTQAHSTLNVERPCTCGVHKNRGGSQSKNTRVFGQGEEGRSKNRKERRHAILVSQSTASVSRVGKNEGRNTRGRDRLLPLTLPEVELSNIGKRELCELSV